MRRFAVVSFVTAWAAALPAGAQSIPPPPPGRIGPSPTNPLDTGNGSMQGTNPQGVPGPNPISPVGTPPPNVNPVPATDVVPSALPRLGGPPPSGAVRPAPGVAVPPPGTRGIEVPPVRLPASLTPQPGGLTADRAAQLALRTSYQVRAAEANLHANNAAQAEAGRQMIPNLTGSFRYTRLSPYTVGAVSFGGQTIPLGIPIVNQYDLRVTLTVPLSDIPLRLMRSYEAAGLNAEAAALNVDLAREQGGQDARIAFYEYLRSVAQAVAVDAAIDTAQRRRDDMQRAVQAGTAARADFLRAEAQVEDFQQQAMVAHNNVTISEIALRQKLHLGPEEPITLGESLEGDVEIPGNLADLLRHARASRPEITSIDRQVRAIGANAAATRASQYPSVTAVGNFDYLNPNTRVFPQTPNFSATWDVTLQATWSPTQAFIADATLQRLDAQREQLVAQQQTVRESVEIEVQQMYLGARSAQAALQARRASLASAEENARVIRERVGAGAAVVADLSNADTELTRARLNLINAYVDLREALVRLRRASGQREAVPQEARR